MVKYGWTLLVMFLVSGTTLKAQNNKQFLQWHASLLREDGNKIQFEFDQVTVNGKTVLYIINDKERIRVDKFRQTKDSVFFEMPVFESVFKAKKMAKDRWEGTWTKGTSGEPQVMPFFASAGKRILPSNVSAKNPVFAGRWEISFTKSNGQTRPAIGEWRQQGNRVSGTIWTPTGDYRYLWGFVKGDSLQLGTFDGSHAYLFTAKHDKEGKVTGVFYSGASGTEPWVATKNENAVLPDIAAMYLKDGEDRLDFRFPDLDDKLVSLSDSRFKNKVVIIQIMGSWCPNCMDETAFLSEYYDRNKHRGVEVIALAYEYSADPERSKNSIRKFKDRFQVQYPLLNTGVTVSDSLRTEKTLPQLTTIKSFPSTIFIDKAGKVAKIYAGFSGPGTGIHYEALKKEFEATVNRLLAE